MLIIANSKMSGQEIKDVILNVRDNEFTISYSIVNARDIQVFDVSVYVSIDDGSWELITDNLTGAVGTGQKAGINKIIYWKPTERQEGKIKVKVSAIVREQPSDTDIKPEMVFVQGGTFQMGSNNGDDDERPVHAVQ